MAPIPSITIPHRRESHTTGFGLSALHERRRDQARSNPIACSLSDQRFGRQMDVPPVVEVRVAYRMPTEHDAKVWILASLEREVHLRVISKT
jgi:hypothetical protein